MPEDVQIPGSPYWYPAGTAELVDAFEKSVSALLPLCYCGEPASFRIVGKGIGEAVVYHQCAGHPGPVGYTVPDWLSRCAGLEMAP